MPMYPAGKSYIGIAIVKTLVRNAKSLKRQEYERLLRDEGLAEGKDDGPKVSHAGMGVGPILVLCYTNRECLSL